MSDRHSVKLAAHEVVYVHFHDEVEHLASTGEVPGVVVLVVNVLQEVDAVHTLELVAAQADVFDHQLVPLLEEQESGVGSGNRVTVRTDRPTVDEDQV